MRVHWCGRRTGTTTLSSTTSLAMLHIVLAGTIIKRAQQNSSTVWANNNNIEFLVRCMAESGSTLEWPEDWDLNRIVDKHSTGGVGDKEYTLWPNSICWFYWFMKSITGSLSKGRDSVQNPLTKVRLMQYILPLYARFINNCKTSQNLLTDYYWYRFSYD